MIDGTRCRLCTDICVNFTVIVDIHDRVMRSYMNSVGDKQVSDFEYHFTDIVIRENRLINEFRQRQKIESKRQYEKRKQKLEDLYEELVLVKNETYYSDDMVLELKTALKRSLDAISKHRV